MNHIKLIFLLLFLSCRSQVFSQDSLRTLLIAGKWVSSSEAEINQQNIGSHDFKWKGIKGNNIIIGFNDADRVVKYSENPQNIPEEDIGEYFIVDSMIIIKPLMLNSITGLGIKYQVLFIGSVYLSVLQYNRQVALTDPSKSTWVPEKAVLFKKYKL